MNYNLLSYAFGVLSILMSILIWYLEKKGKDNKNAELFLMFFTVATLACGYFGDKQSSREYKRDKLKSDLEISSAKREAEQAKLKTNELQMVISHSNYNTEQLKNETEHLRAKSTENGLLAKKAVVEAEKLRINAAVLMAKNDTITLHLNYERYKRLALEVKTGSKRELLQSGPNFSTLAQIQGIECDFYVVDNGEAIGMKGQLQTLVSMLRWKNENTTTFLEQSDRFMLGVLNNHRSIIDDYTRNGITIIHVRSKDYFNKNKSELAADALEKYLLAAGIYAVSKTDLGDDFKLPDNVISIIIGKPFPDENELLNEIYKTRPEVLDLKLKNDTYLQKWKTLDSLSKKASQEARRKN